MFQNSFDLLAGHAGKPSDELLDVGTAFNVFKQSSNGNARAFEKPSTADLPGNAFYGWAL